MAVSWEGFLDYTREGEVVGTLEFFDTEAQVMAIRPDDKALVSGYGDIEHGQWFDAEFGNALRIGRFGLSQFVPWHTYNGEVWAVGITPTAVPADEGRFPTPAVGSGLWLYRYKYYEDLTPRLKRLDTSEQSENPIKDAGIEVLNVGEGELNKKSSIFAPGSRVITKIGMGDSAKMYLSTVFLDVIDWSKDRETMSLSGRNAIGYYLAEQTFDESVQYAGTRTSVLRDILLYSGVDMSKVHIEDHGWGMTALFKPSDTLLYGLNHLIDIFGWQLVGLPDGRIIIGSPEFVRTFARTAIHKFEADEVFTRGITQRADGAYSRLALQSEISADTGPPEVLGFTRTVYKDLPYYDGWNIGGRRTLYITTLADRTELEMEELLDQYAKAYQFIGVNINRDIPIHPEIQSGDVLEITDADSEEYIIQGIITGVRHQIDINSGSATTELSVDSGGTIEGGATIKTYAAADVTGDTRQQELIDVVRKAAQEAQKE